MLMCLSLNRSGGRAPSVAQASPLHNANAQVMSRTASFRSVRSVAENTASEANESESSYDEQKLVQKYLDTIQVTCGILVKFSANFMQSWIFFCRSVYACVGTLCTYVVRTHVYACSCARTCMRVRALAGATARIYNSNSTELIDYDG